ncbi:hypothetical protein NOF04DRAFT_18091 [Fusarium oxysporum II5]|uniref:CHAT domain-containing protein n=1 Tax=Fusarium odoratissimum (strain NRRL 54006) TaxID=1089451 RepID=X0IQQ8_FUSO5|nr:uncharacterized protein FOIG_15588 [Fusarium odoratissimum NRRL 54006]EXL91182.1 hypothetical protein FOIG_15588 [Fusarium odoratissimum NRRL 54006]KAK2132063.1 hypothetical protein NOF04DRAFT_18091 [Fusarium oxysporum II5]
MAEDEEAEPDQPMRFLATDCNELFEQIIKTSSVNQREIISQTIVYRDAFSALTSFLCFFSEPGSSLDYRLRRHESIQDIMIRLLELLRQNLFIVFDFLSNTKSERPQDLESEARAALAGIKDSLKSLNKLAITIRQSSRSYALTLARNFATMNRSLEDLEELILTSLETLYPNAPESLREHICNTLTDRYARLEYSAYINDKSSSKSLKQAQGGEAPMRPKIEEEATGQTSVISRSKTVEFDYVQKKTQEENPNLQQKPLSSLDTGLLRQRFNNEHIKSSRSKRTLSVYESDGHLYEPKPPKFEAGEAEVQCEWCNELLDRSVVRNNRWSNIGRLHYKRDLKPFPCLSETCGESRPSFSSRKQWLEHMRSKHSMAWPQTLYGEMMWVCHDHVEDGESIPYAFSSKNDLDQHMLVIHHSKKRLSDNKLTKYLEHQSSLIDTMSPSSCPLCFFEVENSLGAKQTSSSKSGGTPPEPSKRVQSSKKNQKRVDSRVRFADDVKAASEVDTGDDPDHDSSALFALEIHIAAHLQYLLVMSLRLMETIGHDTDEESLTGPHGSNDPATGSISSLKDGPELDTWSGEEPALVYISDPERVQLEQMRLNEEAAENVLSPYEEGQWGGLDLLADGPAEEDAILQHFSNKQKELSRIESCRKSVRGLRQDLTKAHDERVENGYRWREIGLLQSEIFRESKEVDDLNQAIEAFQRAAETIPSEHSVRWQNLADLSAHLIEKYKIERHGMNLDRAIEITGRVVATNNDTHQQLDHYIHLSNLYRWRYSETGMDEDLVYAVQIARQAIGLVPEDSDRQARYRNHLGQLLTLDYWRTGIEKTIDEAIYELRLALHYVTEEDIEYSEYLATLSVGLDKKFAMSGSQEELDEAMQLMRRSIDLVAERDPAYLRRLNSLGVMLGELYNTTGATDALEESIQVARNVVASTPENDIDAADRMAYLAARLGDRFKIFGELELLEEAIYLSTTAKALTLVEHSSYHVYCHNLATRIFERFFRTMSSEDLRDTILNSSEAVKLLPDTDVNKATYLCLLADATLELADHLGDHQQQRESLDLYERALNHGYSSLQSRLQAGQKLFEANFKFQNWDGAFKVAKTTIGCLAHLPFAELEQIDKHRILQTTGWITSDGVAAALNAGRAPFEVLSFLEDSRWLDANSGGYYLDDFERLRQAHPSKLDELLSIRKDLGKPIIVPPAGFIGNSPWKAQSRRRHQASIECERILTEIRKEPGFSNWLNHEDETRMLQAGTKGPVVVLTTSYIRFDAIIIYQDTIEVVSLPDLDYGQFLDKSDLRSRFTVATSLWIWETIAKPVLVHLGLSPAPSNNRPRLWLIPTGPLTNLPIHAAGDYTRRRSESISISDCAVCSYSTSIKALNLARERPVAMLDGARALLVRTGDSLGAYKEISTLDDICRSQGLEVSQPNLKEGVLQALASCTLFHFAGLFGGSRGDPFKSQLLLANGSITAKDILDATPRLHPPYLAYLSGCGRSRSFEIAFANECLHAAGALHTGGFRHAIGTLGLVDDELCAEISGLFYGAWANREFSDDTVALCLHDATRQCRDRWIAERIRPWTGLTHRDIMRIDDDDDDDDDDERELSWASFIHLGP